MAIVICPNCNKRTSSVGGKCRSCGAQLDSGSPEKSERLARRARRARTRSMSMQAALATLLGMGAGLWLMFGEGPRAGGPTRWLAVLLFVAGLGWYVYVRIALWLHRRN